jgi:predicted nucleic acid-binding protein
LVNKASSRQGRSTWPDQAALADCGTLWSEHMRDGQVIAGVTIRNPFAND